MKRSGLDERARFVGRCAVLLDVLEEIRDGTGTALSREVQRRLGVALSATSLYFSLRYLEDAGLVRKRYGEIDPRSAQLMSAGVIKRPIRLVYYSITQAGKHARYGALRAGLSLRGMSGF